MKEWISSLAWALFCCVTLAGPLYAAEENKSQRDVQVETLLKANAQKLVYGPATVQLGDQALMTIQRGQAFMPPDVAQQMFAISGQKKIEGLLGLVLPGLPGDEVPTDNWGVVVLIHHPIGFVRDDDAKTWNHSRILENIRKGYDASNERKRGQGLPEHEVNGWIDPPRYDASVHRLIWSMSIQQKGKPDTAYAVYNTAALGRDGMLTFLFGTEQNKLAERKDLAVTMLSGIEFKQGRRYEDYAEGTDKVAEIGLAALVGGAVAKKLGLFATLAVLLAKWGKVLAAAGVGVLAFFKLRKKKDQV